MYVDDMHLFLALPWQEVAQVRGQLCCKGAAGEGHALRSERPGLQGLPEGLVGALEQALQQGRRARLRGRQLHVQAVQQAQAVGAPLRRGVALGAIESAQAPQDSQLCLRSPHAAPQCPAAPAWSFCPYLMIPQSPGRV